MQRIKLGVLARFPRFAPIDALSEIAIERQLVQGINESTDSFIDRLLNVWGAWTEGGTYWGLLAELAFAAGYNGGSQRLGLHRCQQRATSTGQATTSRSPTRSTISRARHRASFGFRPGTPPAPRTRRWSGLRPPPTSSTSWSHLSARTGRTSFARRAGHLLEASRAGLVLVAASPTGPLPGATTGTTSKSRSTRLGTSARETARGRQSFRSYSSTASTRWSDQVELRAPTAPSGHASS